MPSFGKSIKKSALLTFYLEESKLYVLSSVKAHEIRGASGGIDYFSSFIAPEFGASTANDVGDGVLRIDRAEDSLACSPIMILSAESGGIVGGNWKIF